MDCPTVATTGWQDADKLRTTTRRCKTGARATPPPRRDDRRSTSYVARLVRGYRPNREGTAAKKEASRCRASASTPSWRLTKQRGRECNGSNPAIPPGLRVSV